MLDPHLARAGVRIGFLVLLLAVGTLPFLPPSSAEFVASLLAATTALLFIAGVAALQRRSSPGASASRSGRVTRRRD